ncbi:MAG TPA: hypothetical protein VGC15_16790, partial [Acetobacteraceae bacterium]
MLLNISQPRHLGFQFGLGRHLLVSNGKRHCDFILVTEGRVDNGGGELVGRYLSQNPETRKPCRASVGEANIAK